MFQKDELIFIFIRLFLFAEYLQIWCGIYGQLCTKICPEWGCYNRTGNQSRYENNKNNNTNNNINNNNNTFKLPLLIISIIQIISVHFSNEVCTHIQKHYSQL